VKLSDIGERKIIEQISKLLSKGDTAVWIGDDCAALDFGADYLLVTTDMISEKTHIPKEMTPFQIGWFIVAINLSDIAAKGGKPIGIVLSLGLPPSTSDSFLNEFTKGAESCVKLNNTNIVGGDTKENTTLTLSGTAIGVVKKDNFMPRKGAKIGDIVAVTGTLGDAGVGLESLNSMKNPRCIKRLMEPTPRIKEGQILSKTGFVSSCMDISDGLSSSLHQLKKINGLGFEIIKDKLPLSKELLKIRKSQTIDVYKHVLHSGGDYELLLTLPKEKFEEAVKELEKIGTNLTEIGHVIKKNSIFIVENGEKNQLNDGGYEHFRGNLKE